MGMLSNSLGLGDVSGDINTMPKGSYPAVVQSSRLVYVSSKNSVSHVVTYRVVAGTEKGKEQNEWFLYGIDPVNAEGQPETDIEKIVSLTPTATEQNKQWYKKRLLDLGLSDEEANDPDPERIVGIAVDMGIKHSNGYQNVAFINLRDGSNDEALAAQGTTGGPAGGGLL